MGPGEDLGPSPKGSDMIRLVFEKGHSGSRQNWSWGNMGGSSREKEVVPSQRGWMEQSGRVERSLAVGLTGPGATPRCTVSAPLQSNADSGSPGPPKPRFPVCTQPTCACTVSVCVWMCGPQGGVSCDMGDGQEGTMPSLSILCFHWLLQRF